MILSFLVLLAFAYYVMNPEERSRIAKPLLAVLRRAFALLQRTGPPARRFARALRAKHQAAVAGVAAIVLVALAAAAFVAHRRSLTDVGPEIARLFVLEEHTARTYQEAVEQFKLGAVSSEALAALIERRIAPRLRTSRARLNALDRVPAEDVQLVARADEYLRLRDESWQLRAKALQRRSMPALRKADQAERASLDALDRIRELQP